MCLATDQMCWRGGGRVLGNDHWALATGYWAMDTGYSALSCFLHNGQYALFVAFVCFACLLPAHQAVCTDMGFVEGQDDCIGQR